MRANLGKLAVIGSALQVLILVGLLAGCGQQVSRVEEVPRQPGVSSRVPVILIPGISRETAGILKGGILTPFSALALRTDADR